MYMTIKSLSRQVFSLVLLACSACGLNGRSSADQLQKAGGHVALDQTITRIDGREEKVDDYRGKALLIVNTASKCGFTKQYAGLEELHRRYGSRGLVVMGFPCNDFMGQEPGSNEEILAFCENTFAVDFPMFAKLKVQGTEAHPLYRALTEQSPEPLRGPIKWNFTKFLVDPQGQVVARFEPKVDPLDADLLAAVERVLPMGL
jgi:glutathione peroxidase